MDRFNTKGEKLIKIWYYGITTLSTVGYGDLYPKTPEERLDIRGAIKIDDVKVSDINLTLEVKEQVIKCGKRKFLKIVQ